LEELFFWKFDFSIEICSLSPFIMFTFAWKEIKIEAWDSSFLIIGVFVFLFEQGKQKIKFNNKIVYVSFF